jgi:hypothetical protein
MAVYLPKYDGYIIDNPNIDFERCDGTVFSYDEVNTASVTNTSNVITITGGQGRSPLAYIDSDMTSELTFASSLFTLEMFAMANAEEITEGDYGTLDSGLYDVADGLTATLPFEVKADSVKVLNPRGLEQATTIAAGKFTVAITASAADTAGQTVVTFNTGDVKVGDTVRIAYKRRIVNGSKVAVTTEATTAKGTLYAHWPVYSSGADCTESSIKGWLHLCMKRCRATALPGFDASYKTAQTQSITFSAIDAKRPDKKFYDIIFEPLEEGEIVNKSSAATVDWD